MHSGRWNTWLLWKKYPVLDSDSGRGVGEHLRLTALKKLPCTSEKEMQNMQQTCLSVYWGRTGLVRLVCRDRAEDGTSSF